MKGWKDGMIAAWPGTCRRTCDSQWITKQCRCLSERARRVIILIAGWSVPYLPAVGFLI